MLNLMPLPRIPQGREVTQSPVSQASSPHMWGGAPGGEVIGGGVIGGGVIGGGAAERAWSQKGAGQGRAAS